MGKKQVLCILLGIILAVVGYLVEKKRDGALEERNQLNRYAYGEGERQQEVWVRGLWRRRFRWRLRSESRNMRKRMQKALLEAGG